MTVAYRDLHALDDLREVTALERAVWGDGYDDLVPASLMVVQVKCGALVLGAFADGGMVGFVYSFPGVRGGRSLQWSHMLGVLPAYRTWGIGRQLKLLQRERTLAQGLDLMEWTYDPLQGLNAHFNVGRLGATVGEYLEDAYGASESPLHRGAPTDRFIAQWWLSSPRVVRRAAGDVDADESTPPGALLNPPRFEGGWWRCDAVSVVPEQESVRVCIPPDFTAMLAEAPAIALDWRLKTRELFQAAFAQGLVVTGFERRPTDCGRYVLTRG